MALSPLSSQESQCHLPIPPGTPKDHHLQLLAPHATCIVHSHRDSSQAPLDPHTTTYLNYPSSQRPYGGPPTIPPTRYLIDSLHHSHHPNQVKLM
jgi:hypothetical protein